MLVLLPLNSNTEAVRRASGEKISRDAMQGRGIRESEVGVEEACLHRSSYGGPAGLAKGLAQD